MAHLDVEDVNISEVTTQTVYDSGYESDNNKEREKGPNKPALSSFITSPADIETHQKVELKDKEIEQSIKTNLKIFVKSIKISFLWILLI